MCDKAQTQHCAQSTATDPIAFALSSKRIPCSQATNSLAGPVYRDIPGKSEVFSSPGVHTDVRSNFIIPQLSRSRSSSGSSSGREIGQLYHGRSTGAYSFSGALQVPGRGIFFNGLSAVSQTGTSPTRSELGGSVFCAISNPDSDGSLDDRYLYHEPALDGMQS
jgi:hypothetical protein